MIYQICLELMNNDKRLWTTYHDMFIYFEKHCDYLHSIHNVYWIKTNEENFTEKLTNLIVEKKWLEPNDRFFISRIDEKTIGGWMGESCWKWFEKEMEEK